MRYSGIGEFLTKGRAALAKGPVAMIFVEDQVEVDSTMTDSDMVDSVLILADGNPRPEVATFHFTALSGAASATTRMRLAKTQNVYAVAKMADGSVHMDKKEVKVTIGGCGG